MLKIPDSFFKEEIRWGYYIPASMKRGWAIQLTVLDEILSLAQKYSYGIWMDCGSLLGTVRHGGFIPWDDDIDVCMLREDYMDFLHILEKELPPERNIYSFYTQSHYHLPKAFVSNRKNIDIGISKKDAELTRIMFDCPYSCGIDIFPLDYIPIDQEYWDQLSQLYIIAYNLGIDYETYLQTGELSSFLDELKKVLNLTGYGDESRDTVWKIAEAISMMTKRNEAGWVTWFPEYAMGGPHRRRTLDAYSGSIMMNFEMMKVPVPIGYEEVLHVLFGDNYMTPIKGTAGHDYPFYKNQERKILFHNRIGQIGDIF